MRCGRLYSGTLSTVQAGAVPRGLRRFSLCRDNNRAGLLEFLDRGG